jgi:limonene 1,2-monooxygenase
MVLLDHLTRGRTMLGLGPGSLPTDSAMIGLNPTDTRELLDINLDIIMRLLRDEEPVTIETPTHRLYDARLHLRPYTEPHFDIAVAAVASPTGPRLAGRYGLGLLSVGATLTAEGFDALGHHWGIAEERAAAYGQTVSRDDWRLVGLVHAAETREQAYKDVEYGIEQWFRYFEGVAAFPQMGIEGEHAKREMVDFVNESGVGAIGTWEDVAGQIEKLDRQSNGGFGCYLLLAHEWANPAATHRSYELIAQHVMPVFQGHAQPTIDARARASSTHAAMAQTQNDAVAHMTQKYEKEVAATQGG